MIRFGLHVFGFVSLRKTPEGFGFDSDSDLDLDLGSSDSIRFGFAFRDPKFRFRFQLLFELSNLRGLSNGIRPCPLAIGWGLDLIRIRFGFGSVSMWIMFGLGLDSVC